MYKLILCTSIWKQTLYYFFIHVHIDVMFDMYTDTLSYSLSPCFLPYPTHFISVILTIFFRSCLLCALFVSRINSSGKKKFLSCTMYISRGLFGDSLCVLLLCRCPGFQKLNMVSGDVPSAFVDFRVRICHSLGDLRSVSSLIVILCTGVLCPITH